MYLRTFFIVPVANVVASIPLLPGGIGVGQVAFFALFQLAGAQNPEQGGALCTLIQIYISLFHLSGIVFYLRRSKLPKPILNTQAQQPA